jgi:hypothetical protein
VGASIQGVEPKQEVGVARAIALGIIVTEFTETAQIQKEKGNV